MTAASSPNSSEPNPLDPIIAAYLEAVERGDKPDRDRLMLDHPQLASELRAFFADLDRVHQAAGKPADYDATVIGMKEPTPGTILGGRYKLLENIGEGGMGSVWVAEQQQPVKRKVAIKLVKAGMDSKQVLARFEAERQALAVMDHPNIAKVFDGGMTDQGRPYFVMEYVKGIPFTEYCDRVKLSLKERLILFIPVCHAVQHAHHKGIVHRDLKPSNILICLYDGKPVPKVIDFGLAKAMHQPLTEKSIHTGHGIMVGTPVYMSPEQAEHNNLDVDTRTDIYSLGVVLYELLVGTTPLERQQLQQAAFDEILRLIKEVEPPRPSVRLSASGSLPSIAAQRSIEPKDLRKSLTGDLDWIVMKSLEKERSRRYETANGFAQDIERFLNEEPVEACPPSRSYLLKKFVRKHRAQVITITAVFMSLLIGILGTSWQAIRATKAELAEKQKTEQAEASEKRAVASEAKARESEKRALTALTAEAAQREKAELHFINGLLRPIGYGETVSDAELRSFVDWSAISVAESNLKLKVLEVAFQNPDTALRLARRADRAIQSSVGLSASRRTAAIQLLTTKQKDQTADSSIRVAACLLAMEIGNTELPALTYSIDRYHKANSDQVSLRPEAEEFINLMSEQTDSLSPEQITCGWDALIELLGKTEDMYALRAAGAALTALAPKLTDDQIARGGDALIDLLGKTKDSSVQQAAGTALVALVPKLSHEQITRGGDALIDVLGETSNMDAVQAAGMALVPLAPKLNDKQIIRGGDALIAVLEEANEGSLIQAACYILVAFAPELSDEQTKRGGDALIAAFLKAEGWAIPKEAGNALVALAPKLSDEQIKRGVNTLIAVLEVDEDRSLIQATGIALVGLAPKLSNDEITRGEDALIAAFLNTSDWAIPMEAGNALVALAPKLSDEQITHGWNALIDVLRKTGNIDAVHPAGMALVAFAPKLSDGQITRGGDGLIAVLGEIEYWAAKEAAGNALVALAPKLNADQTTRGWHVLIDVLGTTENRHALRAAGNALVALTPRLSDDQIARAGDALIAAIQKTKNENAFEATGNVLVAFSPKLSDEQIIRGRDSLVDLLGNTDNLRVGQSAFNTLMAIAPKLRGDEITRGWDSLIALIDNNYGSAVQQAAGKTLVSLAPKLTDEQIIRGRESLLKMVEKGGPRESPAAWRFLLAPPSLDAETRTRISNVIKNDFRCDFIVDRLSKIAPRLDPPNGATLSESILTQLMNDRTTAVDPCYPESDVDNPIAAIETITMAVPEARHIAKMLAHPGAVGEMREALLKRFEELVLYGGQHIFLIAEPEEESSDAPVSAELGGLMHRRSPEESPRNKPEPPPRKFCTIYDVQVWIQQNWPEFNLDETPEVEWPRWR